MATSYEEELDIIDQVNMLDFDNETISSEPPFNLSVENAEYWSWLTSNEFDAERIESKITSPLSPDEKLDFFRFGINCLSKFLQINFTGPPLEEETESFLEKTMQMDDTESRKLLTINNEEVNVNCRKGYLLYAAKAVFASCKVNTMLNAWWQIRALFIHQKILEDLSPRILFNIETLQKEVKDIKISNSNLHALYLLEQGHIFCEYRCVAKADEYIKKAYQMIGLKYKMFGKVGKRTKFQEKSIAQLTLEVCFLDKPDIERKAVINGLTVPPNLALDDDVRLDTVEFENSEADEMTQSFPNIEQKVLLVVALHLYISKPLDDLFYEQLKPFLDVILTQNNTWCVRTSTLLFRCKLESSHKRTIERSLLQSEEIVKSVDQQEPHFLNRISGVFSTGLCPVWVTKQRYADLMLNLGMIKSALDVFIELQLWEEVIVCYTIMDMRHKAEEVIRQQIEVKPTVKLYCLLGDATDDPSCYLKAWVFSKKRSHRAQRHWGNYFFHRKQYEECIPHYEKSLSINPLQAVVWLRLGFAALETEKWQVAATAYRRFTTIEPNGFEAWNNLAQAYLKLDNCQSAYYALQDALRCSFDNWKVWKNFLVVCVRIKRWNDFITAYHKLIDLKGKYLNVHALECLAAHLLQQNAAGDIAIIDDRLRKRTLELLGRVTSIHQVEGAIWEMYAYLTNDPYLEVQRLQKAYRGLTQSNSNWFKDEKICTRVLRVCQRMAEVVLDDDSKFDVMTTNSIRLIMSSALAAAKTSQDIKEVEEYLPDVAILLGEVIEKCKELQKSTSHDHNQTE